MLLPHLLRIPRRLLPVCHHLHHQPKPKEPKPHDIRPQQPGDTHASLERRRVQAIHDNDRRRAHGNPDELRKPKHGEPSRLVFGLVESRIVTFFQDAEEEEGAYFWGFSI